MTNRNDEIKLSGGCHCGAVKYILNASPLSVQHCHCETCRKSTGALHATVGIIQRDKIVIEGVDKLIKYRTSPGFEQQFCRTCGCNLFAYDDDDTTFSLVNLPTLDNDQDPAHPKEMESHIFMSSRATWEHVSDVIPHYDSEDPRDIIPEE
jgi:hypothetical protein